MFSTSKPASAVPNKPNPCPDFRSLFENSSLSVCVFSNMSIEVSPGGTHLTRGEESLTRQTIRSSRGALSRAFPVVIRTGNVSGTKGLFSGRSWPGPRDLRQVSKFILAIVSKVCRSTTIVNPTSRSGVEQDTRCAYLSYLNVNFVSPLSLPCLPQRLAPSCPP
ncbi:hypothetical protein AVEN_219492-1 [Araneus ventricosus]|uniref:Uncharacterized protein n=1 Tax=Araneus ventricosus TaxID=182803 RepID=A0A4Y2BMB7_ARAVE|nr:hypothetical protein AVEN_219492-1 [Araneus ventricosus]